MAKKRSFYSSLKNRTAVPLRDLKPIHVERKTRNLHLSTGKTILTVSVLCVLMMLVTLLVGRNFGPFNTIVNTAALPFRKAFNAVSNWIDTGSENRRTISQLKAENAELRSIIQELQYEQVRNEKNLEELSELQSLYDLDIYYADYPKFGAQIVANSSSNWIESITIDKGSTDGVKRYMPVLASGGLYGYIETVYAHYSRLTPIISESSAVYCEVFRSGDRVLLKGDLLLKEQGLAQIEFEMDQTEIAVGDEIVTSNYSSVYPPGIRVGEVISVRESGDGVTGIAEVRPYSDLLNVSYVLIMTDAAVPPPDEVLTDITDEAEGSAESDQTADSKEETP